MQPNHSMDLSGKIRLIVSDVDGTLVDSKRQCPSINTDAFRLAHQQGITVVIATGRPLDAILPDIRSWGLDGVIQYVVANNGADIYHLEGGTTTHLHFIPSLAENELFHRYANWDVAICAYQGLTLLTNKVNDDYIKRATYARLAMETVDLEAYLKEDLPKLLMIAPCDTLNAIESDYQNHPINPIKLVHYEPNLIEVLHKDLSKVSGVDVIASHYGINHDQIMAFGDSTNDLEMITTYQGVAVSNANPIILDAAKYHALSNDQGGVGRFILDHVLSREV